MLHQMTAGIVRDHRMRHAVPAELPRGERRALIARPRFVGIDMQRDALVMREIDGRRRRAPVHRCQPAGVAMGQHVDALAGFLARGDVLDQPQTVLADRAVNGDILIANLGGAFLGNSQPLAARPVAHRRHHLIERPFQVDRRRPRRQQRAVSGFERFVGGILAQRQHHAISRDRADERRAAHQHRGDRMRGIVTRRQSHGAEIMRQHGLVDDADRAIGLDPDAAHRFAIDLHGMSLNADSRRRKAPASLSHHPWLAPPDTETPVLGGFQRRRPAKDRP